MTMGKLFAVVVLVAIGVGGWFGYQKYLAPPSPAYLAYQQYTEARARELYDKAETLATGQGLESIQSLRQGSAGSMMSLYGKTFQMAPPSIASIAGDVHSIKWNRESEAGDGSRVALVVTETVCRIPPGVNSVICKWPVDFRHEAEVVLEGGAWKVSSFKETRITPQ